MANTCIVCGQAAGSGEHVFPAALGGRRTNKNIYCTKHDNGYSGLVAALAGQVDVINALLGVVPDHSNEVKSVLARDVSSGEELRVSVKQASFTAPRVLSQEQTDTGTLMNMSFPTREAMRTWLAEQEAKGVKVTPLRKAEERPFYLGEVHHQRQFGGPFGLGAVGYVSQTFLAQAFPELARSGALAEFIGYTQSVAALAQMPGARGEVAEGLLDPKLKLAQETLEAALAPWGGQAPVWWDFEPQPNATPNQFDFGHRVTVGVDALDGQIFGRFALFSSLHFSVLFGKASAGVVSRTVTVDIDPMAAHPPNDIAKTEVAEATARVTRPGEATASLATAIADKSQAAVFNDLFQRIQAHSLSKTAEAIHTALAIYPTLSEFEGDQLLARVIDGQAQRILNMTTFVLERFKATLPSDLPSAFGAGIDGMTAYDPSSSNGLSTMATAILELAKGALISQMRDDLKNNLLDRRRIEQLMGEGPGAAVVGAAVLAPITQVLGGEQR